LEPGTYTFTFEIPPYRLAEGEYKIKFDIAERNIKRYTTDNSNLTFRIFQDENGFGNRFCESLPIKSSLFRENWLKGINKL
jgi:lipopolysaccharide transport system ATP-binding protein